MLRSALLCFALLSGALSAPGADGLDAALMASFEAGNAMRVKQRYPVIALPPLVSDAVFLRRACIDVAGRLPTATEVCSFVDDKGTDKRGTVVDRLLEEPGAAEVRFRWLAEALRVDGSAPDYTRWLREMVAKDVPMDLLVTELLTATADDPANPAQGFWTRDAGDPLRMADEVAQVFLGEEIHCTHCHNHPFNDHTQREFYEFASCFADLLPRATRHVQKSPLVPGATLIEAPHGPSSRDGRGLLLPPAYKYRDGRSGQRVTPGYLALAHPLPRVRPQAASVPSMRAELAEWITHGEHRRFPLMMAQRVWAAMFGVAWGQPTVPPGIVTPVGFHGFVANGLSGGCSSNGVPLCSIEDGRPDAASITMQELFMEGGYRLKEFQRMLAHSLAYQRGSVSADLGQPWRVPAPLHRRLSAEVLWDTWAQWLPAEHPLAKRSADQPEVPQIDHPLHLLGRGERVWADERAAPVNHALIRFVMNDPAVEAACAAPALRLRAADLFLTLLNRQPTAAERDIAEGALHDDAVHGAADVAWALMNTAEFLFQP
jgi:hypothetical protein